MGGGRVGSACEDNRNGRGCGFCRLRRRWTASRDYGYLTADEQK
jgi:hypothetical protein